MRLASQLLPCDHVHVIFTIPDGLTNPTLGDIRVLTRQKESAKRGIRPQNWPEIDSSPHIEWADHDVSWPVSSRQAAKDRDSGNTSENRIMSELVELNRAFWSTGRCGTN